MSKYSKHKKQSQEDQQSIKVFDTLYRKSLQDNLIDKIEYGPLCKMLSRCVDQKKKEFFIVTAINVYSANRKKLNLEPRT